MNSNTHTKVNGIRHVVKLRENVMMNENKVLHEILINRRIFTIKRGKEKPFKFSCLQTLFKDVIIRQDVC